MKAYIFDNVDELNKFIDSKKHKQIDVQWCSKVVGTRKDKEEVVYEVVDRWMILVK